MSTGVQTTPAREHAVVDDRAAEDLEREFPCFTVVEIRECTESEPLATAHGVLWWASCKDHPYRALRSWALENRRGYYRVRGEAADERAGDEQRRYQVFLARKQDESLQRRGYGLSEREIERLARLFFAPAHRARMNLTPEPGEDEDDEHQTVEEGI